MLLVAPQLESSPDAERNLDHVRRAVAEATERGARLVALQTVYDLGREHA